MLPDETAPQLPLEFVGEIQPVVTPRDPFWGYSDLFLFIGLTFFFVLIFCSPFLVFIARDPVLSQRSLILALLSQGALYAAIYVSFRLILGIRYHRPVMLSLGWVRSSFNLLLAAVGGGVLAFVVSGLATLLHTPKVASPIEQFTKSVPSLAMLVVLAVVLAPLFEELVFRGFLQPLFSRSFGVIAGVLITAILFGALHAPEYSWAWQYAVAVSVVGAVLGWVRARAKSIIPTTVMHGCYNSVFVAALILSKYVKH